MKDYKVDQKVIKLWKVRRPSDLILIRSIVSNPFRFVEFQLRSSSLKPTKKDEALLLWHQAEQFYLSSKQVSTYSRPLTNYYFILNAVKTLLLLKGVNYNPHHGVSGQSQKAKNLSLSNEILTIDAGKICGRFYNYLDASHNAQVQYNLKELFYNLPFTHRAFLQCYTNHKDLFLPVDAPRFVDLDDGIHLVAKCRPDNLTKVENVSNFLRSNQDFSLVKREGDEWLVSKRICNTRRTPTQKKKRILNEYAKLRSSFCFIEGDHTLWYFRKVTTSTPAKNKLPIPVNIFAVAHRLSELSRYHPMQLKRHLSLGHGWMVHEFIDSSAEQFLSFISCEMSEKEIAKPKLR